MPKRIASISVDTDIWDIVTSRYPKKVSALINNFLQTLIDVDPILSDQGKTFEELDKELLKKKKTLATAKSEIEAIEKIKLIREQETNKADVEQLKKESDIITAMRNAGLLHSK